MFILFFLLTLIFGLYFGSFFTAVAVRISNEEKVFVKHSTCDACKNRIGLFYLIPVFGYVFCKGKCKKCGGWVSVEYTVWEMLHASLWCLNYFLFKNQFEMFLVACVISSVLVFISIIDVKTMYVYDFHILILFILLLGFQIMKNNFEISANFIAIAVLKAFIPLVFKFVYEGLRQVITKEKVVLIGMGDVKIFIILFFLLDFHNLAFLIGTSGAFGMLFFVANKGRKTQEHYPFVPSIALATYIFFVML